MLLRMPMALGSFRRDVGCDEDSPNR